MHLSRRARIGKSARTPCRPHVPWLPCALLLSLAAGWPAQAPARSNFFFLHHSTGRNLLDQGYVRQEIAIHNEGAGTDFELWDHDYNYIGLRNGQGIYLNRDYGIPGDNTDPDGLYVLWTTENAARDSILANHEVIAFKSCYPAAHIDSDAKLAQYQAWYLAMRAVFDQHPERTFVVMSPPPLHRLDTNLSEADRARAFANWLGSADYLAGHANIVYFDLFDLLAQPDDGSATRNMLRYMYERSHTDPDSRPNTIANQAVGPVFAGMFIRIGMETSDVDDDLVVEATPPRLGCSPNPLRDAGVLHYETAVPGTTRLLLYDAQGRLALMHECWQPAGSHDFTMLAETLPSAGIYWAAVRQEGGQEARVRVVVMR